MGTDFVYWGTGRNWEKLITADIVLMEKNGPDSTQHTLRTGKVCQQDATLYLTFSRLMTYIYVVPHR